MDVQLALIYALAERLMLLELRVQGLRPGSTEWRQAAESWQESLPAVAARYLPLPEAGPVLWKPDVEPD